MFVVRNRRMPSFATVVFMSVDCIILRTKPPFFKRIPRLATHFLKLKKSLASTMTAQERGVMFTYRPSDWQNQESYYMLLSFEKNKSVVKPYCIVEGEKFDFDANQTGKCVAGSGGKYKFLKEFRAEVLHNVRNFAPH